MEKDKPPDPEDIKLTAVQAGMLLFFAGELDTPSGHASTTRALVTRGLLEHSATTNRYEINALGRQVAARLDRRTSTHEFPSRATRTSRNSPRPRERRRREVATR